MIGPLGRVPAFGAGRSLSTDNRHRRASYTTYCSGRNRVRSRRSRYNFETFRCKMLPVLDICTHGNNIIMSNFPSSNHYEIRNFHGPSRKIMYNADLYIGPRRSQENFEIFRCKMLPVLDICTQISVIFQAPTTTKYAIFLAPVRKLFITRTCNKKDLYARSVTVREVVTNSWARQNHAHKRRAR